MHKEKSICKTYSSVREYFTSTVDKWGGMIQFQIEQEMSLEYKEQWWRKAISQVQRITRVKIEEKISKSH